MSEDHQLILNESHRLAQYEALKGEMRNSVQTDIAREPPIQITPGEQARITAAGEQIRQQAAHETLRTESELSRGHFAARASQVVDFVFYLIYGVIALEIILNLAGANPRNAFRQLIGRFSTPLLWPFENLLADPEAGRFQFRLSYVIGLLVYVLLHVTITKLLRLLTERKTSI